MLKVSSKDKGDYLKQTVGWVLYGEGTCIKSIAKDLEIQKRTAYCCDFLT